MGTSPTSVLIATKDSKISSLIMQMLVKPVFDATLCTDFNDARRKLSNNRFDIVIIDSGDGADTELAVDISDSLSTIILLAPTHLFDQISYHVEAYGILTVPKPFDGFYFYNIIKVALAVNIKVERISSQTVKLKEKMEEIRVVNRAKLILVQNQHMTEQEAHHFLEKEAMNRCIKRVDLANEIIREAS